MPVSFSALEMSFMGIEQEELAIISFFYKSCNVQCTVYTKTVDSVFRRSDWLLNQ